MSQEILRTDPRTVTSRFRRNCRLEPKKRVVLGFVKTGLTRKCKEELNPSIRAKRKKKTKEKGTRLPKESGSHRATFWSVRNERGR